MARVSPTRHPTPRHGRNSEGTQRTWPDHRPGRHQPSNHTWVMGICTIPISPNKARSQISTLSWLRDQPSLNCNWRYYLRSAPYAVRMSTFLCYLIELASGYCWSMVLYFALGLFGATLQSHLMKGFFHRPTSGSLQMLHETWSLIAIFRGRNDPAPVKRSTSVWVKQCADLQFVCYSLANIGTGHSFCFYS